MALDKISYQVHSNKSIKMSGAGHLPVVDLDQYNNIKLVEKSVSPVLFSPHVRESKTLLDSGFHAVDSGFHLLDSRSFSVELGFRIRIVSGIPDSYTCIPNSKAQDSGFHKQKFPRFRIPNAKISRIPESGFLYMGQLFSKKAKQITFLPQLMKLTT